MHQHLRKTITLLFLMFTTFYAGASTAGGACPDKALTLQVLGSGGPIADDRRASSSYVVWHKGKSRYLIDAGGGAFVRFAQSGAKIRDLDALAISHFHADHSADVPAILKSGYFSERKSPLLITGPSSGGPFPDTKQFLNALFNKENGAFGYLAGYLDGSDGLFELRPMIVDTKRKTGTELQTSSDAKLEALGVPHGPVPALAYRLELDGKSIVFSSDQNGSNSKFTEFSKDADILVFHMAVPENSNDTRLHAKPSEIGKIAAEANVEMLVLSHFMQRSLRELDKNVALVREHYKGKVVTAKDLQCFSLAH